MEYSGSQKAESFLSSSKFKVLPRGAVGASEAELLWLLPRVQGKVQEANMVFFRILGLSLDLKLSLRFFKWFLRVLVMPRYFFGKLYE